MVGTPEVPRVGRDVASPCAFKAWRREKPPIARLLEEATDVNKRISALQALAVFSLPTVAEQRGLFLHMVAASLGSAPLVGRSSGSRVCSEPRPSLAELRRTQDRVPFIYAPVTSIASTSARGPWEGHRFRLAFSAARGNNQSLAAAALTAGMYRAGGAAPCELQGGEGPVDPSDIPWAHVMVAVMRRFSSHVGGEDAPHDSAAATFRFLLGIAAQRPWCAVMDFPLGFRSSQDGAPWRLLQGILLELGYVVDAVEVCPSRCLECTWVCAREPAVGCRGS
jgi:hypothetical protein